MKLYLCDQDYRARYTENTRTAGYEPYCTDHCSCGLFTIDGVRMPYEQALIYLTEVNCMTTREAISYLRKLRGGVAR